MLQGATVIDTTTILPLPFVRRPHQHRFQAWAPKLSRCVVLASWAVVQLWAWLEGNPDVKRYCERPATTIIDNKEQLVDFWFQHGDKERWWIIRADGEPLLEREASESQARNIGSDCIEFVSSDSFAAHKVWIDNWLSILPYLASNARWVEPALIAQVIADCKAGTTLQTIEHTHAGQDRMLVRTAVFIALHRGDLIGIDLHERRWNLDSQFVISPRRGPHAT